MRAAVLGANDGIISTASLVVGVAAAASSRGSILVAGVAGLVAGALSMAVGEYVSVHSQADLEVADLSRERDELARDPVAETRELTGIYIGRGLTPALARQVAGQLMEHDALDAHARDELGISGTQRARPVQAALASAASFAVGAALPLVVVALAPPQQVITWVFAAAIVFLALLGAVAARIGDAPALMASLRVSVLGALAMAVTAVIGALFGAVA